jgi:hypothetical protein
VDVTAQLRARAIQAGAVLALVGGMLAVASSPALAADPAVQISVGSREVQSGATVDMSYTVTNNNDQPGVFVVNIAGNGFTCVSGDCSPQAPIGGHNTSQPFKATLKAPTIAAGQNQTIPVAVIARSAANPNDNGQDNVQFAVQGADKPQSVRQVTGRVKDDNGKAVTGAVVGMLDSQNHRFQGTTNDEGRFQFSSTDQVAIAPGALAVGATKDGFKPVTVNVQGAVDKTVAVTLTLTAVEATASASPSATASPSAPADDATLPATGDATPPAATNPQNTANNSKGNSTLYIILGALLVAAGIGAIVLLVMRRRNKKDDGGDPDDFGGGAGGGPVPPSQGRYNGVPDQTRVVAPIGAGVSDATRIRQASLADAPTMMQQAVPAEDEFPDPYGAPAVPGGGYAGAGGYGAAPPAGGAYGQTTQYGGGAYGGGARVPAQSGGYDAGPPTQFGAPDDGAYGAYAPQAGYGAPAEQPRYDEPTGMYRPGFDDNAGYQEGQYGGAAAEPAPEYGSWGAPGGGIDSGNGYGPASGQYGGGRPGQYGQEPSPEQYGGQYGDGGGTYGGGNGGAQYSGYDQGGYDQAGYDQRGGYGRGESYDQGGYDQGGAGPAAPSGPPAPGGGGTYGGAYSAPGADEQPPGYYGGEQGGGRHGGQSPRPPEQPPRGGGQRRNIDWLDD